MAVAAVVVLVGHDHWKTFGMRDVADRVAARKCAPITPCKNSFDRTTNTRFKTTRSPDRRLIFVTVISLPLRGTDATSFSIFFYYSE